MAKGKDRQPLYMVRKGLSLVPHLEMDADTISALPEGVPIRVSVVKGRYLPRLQAYWCLLHECVKATGCAVHANALHGVVKTAVGLVDIVTKANGSIQAVPSSIALDEMKDEAEMVAYFQAAEEVLAHQFDFVSEHENSNTQRPSSSSEVEHA